jgi:hypothetical protein
VPPSAVDRSQLVPLAVGIEARVAHLGLPGRLARLAFATLVDNALEHGSSTVAPRVCVSLTRSHLMVSSHDAGEEIGHARDPKGELQRRIQLCVEDPEPLPGAPAGIPWLASLLSRRRPGSELLFRAGDGELAWSRGVWTCSQRPLIHGFLAIARIAV